MICSNHDTTICKKEPHDKNEDKKKGQRKKAKIDHATKNTYSRKMDKRARKTNIYRNAGILHKQNYNKEKEHGMEQTKAV